ncbi:MAG TPA: beta-L-arabinofuranosidase domain-containing protein [Vicinamibacteria bacterium]|nr:beta-L-arabinofuranosidase domain-containing protein [Vicinamibacteria bacterium]
MTTRIASPLGWWTRRRFLGATGASAALAAGARHALAGTEASEWPRGAACVPRGDFGERVALTARRLTSAGSPAYTEPFILADVTLDPERRFWDFSGDLSGRYVEALAALPPAGRSARDLEPLVRAILANQRPDGRFGRSDLAFTAQETGREHMALLWGNGRLLVGLMAYHEATGDGAALAAARRLAGFLLGVRESARAPEVMRRVEGQGAFGFICFTQLAEGLVRLGRATGDRRAFDAAAEIVPLLPPRGVQHSHGYLTTLRGALLLHEATGDAAMRSWVERLWTDFVGSADYVVDGSALEYFGWGEASDPQSLRAAKEASGEFPRNEGCGLADVVRLALHLHRVTGKEAYLEQAERCYVNAFAHNQFATGDFGSRVWFRDGLMPTPSVDRAWWCCTMHGYRAYRDVLDAIVSEAGNEVTIRLFDDVDFEGRTAALRLRRTPDGFQALVTRAFDGVVAVRHPSWADGYSIRVGGEAAPTASEGGFCRLRRTFRAGDRIDGFFGNRLRLVRPDGSETAPPGVTPVRAALYCGPFLMGVDEGLDPLFFSEPWPGNVATLPAGGTLPRDAAGRVRIPVRYEHEGYRGSEVATLRAMGEKPADDQRTFAVWLSYRSATPRSS